MEKKILLKINWIIKIVISAAFILAVMGFSSPAPAQGPTAFEVVDKMDNREDGDTMTSDTLMILINKKNQKRIRNIKTIRKDYDQATKGIIFFLSPADVRNTAYMSYDWDELEKEDDSWLYLPALQRVKRVAAGDRSGAFMGSDFSYSDINGIEISYWHYTFAKENEKLDKIDTWVIQGQPKPEFKEKVLEETGYLKSLLWIRKDNYMLVKGKYWVKQGRKIKYLKAEDIKSIDGIETAHTLTMVTTSRGKVDHSSVLKVSNVKYNLRVKDATFTTRRMEQGL